MDLLVTAVALLFGLLGWLILYQLDKKRNRTSLRRQKLKLFQFQRTQLAKERKADLDQGGKSVEHPAIRYDEYQLTRTEWVVSAAAAGICFFAVGYLFYKNFLAAAAVSSAGLKYPAFRRKHKLEKRRTELSLQFKQALQSLSSLLAAGRSVENALVEAVEDLKLLYPDPKTNILVELERINAKISVGETVEKALLEFSGRTGVEDIISFTDVFTTCKRTGGNLVEVLRRTAQIIAEKVETKQEIEVLMAQKRFESKVLVLSPIVMLSLLSFSSPDYMLPLYTGISGAVIMTFSLAALLGFFVIALKIMNIRV